ncbi:NADH dehydrogenase subunit 6 (mitochondrion) [Dermatophagoides farinae]|uniref:NADH dehydrogenase subunit 6 n=1 Tax=Dermatophagoides farinae TaxID=6954 RepID=UPI0001B2DB84|nr:NADH dehydrogenase subunit 6 [Dermatophagoides farinae]ACV04220.1 NADH dehydrogenase subunit 6 [Dermatophagoides farinae]
MLLIISSIWALTLIKQSSSPFKLSLFLTMTSTLMSGVLYLMCNSIFIPCSLIISFSSGMMILFLYCSLCSTYESKNNLKMNTIMSVTIMMTLALHVPEEKYMYSLEKTMNMTSFSYSLMFVMFMVIISMKCMNTSFFNPTKKMMQSY